MHKVLSQPTAIWGLALFLSLGSFPAQANLLLDLYRQALQHEPNLQAAAAERDAALQAKPLLRSEVLPQLSVSAQAAYLEDETKDSQFIGFPREEREAETWNVALNLRQTVFNAASFSRLRQIDEKLARAELLYQEARLSLMMDLLERYFAWLSAEDTLRLAKQHKSAIWQQKRETQGRLETGYANQADFELVNARYDHAQAEELRAAAIWRSSREAMRELVLDLPKFPQSFAPALSVKTPQPAQPQAWVARALEGNLSLRVAALDVKLSEEKIREQKAAHWPELELQVTQRWQDNQDLQLGRESESSTIGLNFKMPIYSGGRDSAASEQARLASTRQKALFMAQQRRVKRQTREAYDGVVTGIEWLKANEQSLNSSAAALQAVEGAYATGLKTAAELLDAQANHVRTQKELASAKYEYLLSHVRLQWQAGRLRIADLLSLDQQLQP